MTASVDFALLREAVSDLRVFFLPSPGSSSDSPPSVLTHGPISQADFLTRMGIDVRVEALKLQATSERASEIETAAKRLTDLTGMGKQYQVLGFTSEPISGEENGPWPFAKLEGSAAPNATT